MKRWTMIILSLSLLLTFAACAGSQQQEEEETGLLVHYVATNHDAHGGDAIRGVEVDLGLAEDASLQEQAEAMVKKMLENPADIRLQSPLPENAELLNVTVQGRRAVVDFSAGFNRLSGVELTLANSCLVLSLSQLESINSVAVTVQGRPVVQQPQQVFYEWNVLLSSMDDVMQTVEATLYYTNETGELVGEPRVLEVYEGQFVAENLVLELLQGPENRELMAVLPDEFQINSVRVDSGVCYVNLPAASLELLPEEEGRQLLMLQSLAYSLYSIDNVEQLRLLVDGTELEYFGSVPVEVVGERPQE